MLVPYPQAAEVVDQFIKLLAELQISTPKNSAIEGELLSFVALLDAWKDPKGVESEARLIREAAGAHDLAAKVLCARSCPEFPSLVPHLRAIVDRQFLGYDLGEQVFSSVLHEHRFSAARQSAFSPASTLRVRLHREVGR
jgi:hypothetical protein